MKRQTRILTSLFITIFLLAAGNLSAQLVFKATSKSVIAFYQYLPKDYASNSNKYPVVIMLHGIGERGANTTNLTTLAAGIWTVAKNGPALLVKQGQQFPFILIAPQLKNNYGTWPSAYVMEVIDYVKTYLRIDEKRIHVTGFSLGGGGAWVAAQDFPKVFASVSPMCGGYNSPSKAAGIGNEDLPTWAFHGDADPVVPLSKSKNMVNAINTYHPSPNAKLTIYPGVKHNCWGRAYNATHTYHNPNVYDWIMAQTNKINAGNVLPTANAGVDQSKSSGTSATLSGSGTDSDGTIASYKWSKIAGNAMTFGAPTSKSTTVSGLKAGTYIFCLQVTDSKGSIDRDYVKVTIGSTTTTSTLTGSTTTTSTSNVAPGVSAGANLTVKLPTNYVTIYGKGTDSDGTIAAYKWTQLQGPNAASLSGATSSKVTASGLVRGWYVFRLTVKDNDGATRYDDMGVKVE
jgi:dienelactone hydrolase